VTEYRMDEAHGETALDRGTQGLLGAGLDRIDGPAKVTGAATYAAEFTFDRPMAYGVAITATIASGRVASINKTARIPADPRRTDEPRRG
jgi:xanthine dehydrogenase YagR molybdenum-binding subunit